MREPAPNPSTGPGGQRVVTVDSACGWRVANLLEAWEYREILLMLAVRDISARYRQTVLGIGWVVIQPLVVVGVFQFLFQMLMGEQNMPTVEGVPYALSTFCALLPWNFFAASIGLASGSLVSNRLMITKIYFPRMFLPAAPILAATVDLLVGGVALVLLLVAWGVFPDISLSSGMTLLLLPVFLAIGWMTTLGVGLWAAALNALYRDVQYVTPFLLQILMFVSPVVYSTDALLGRSPGWVATLYGCNPLVAVIEGFRWALLGTPSPPLSMIVMALCTSSALLASGLIVFHRLEFVFEDVV